MKKSINHEQMQRRPRARKLYQNDEKVRLDEERADSSARKLGL